MANFVMERTGEFYVKKTGLNSCGVDDILHMQYKVICFFAPSLDHRGFLVDQLTLDKYFQGIKTTDMSCEKMCIQCTEELIDIIHSENERATLTSISVQLSANPFKASMSYFMGKDDIRHRPPYRRESFYKASGCYEQ